MGEKKLAILISLLVVFSICFITYLEPPFLKEWILKLETTTYDRQIKRFHRPLSANSSVVILGIDDASLKRYGRWPWSRELIAKLITQLEKKHPALIAIDMLFSEKEKGPIDQILPSIENPSLKEGLKDVQDQFQPDQTLAKAIGITPSLLSCFLEEKLERQGLLMEPAFLLPKTSSENILIPNKQGYISNLAIFQKAAKGGGFINAMVDQDGILRTSPLLLRMKQKVYPSLALEAARMFLKTSYTAIQTTETGEYLALDAILLKDRKIPTDPWGRILIPFRGPSFSFPYISAKDLLENKVKSDQIENKLIFLGLSATASTDLFSTAISPAVPGVEIQATIASGIIDNYLPHKPNWGRGASILLIALLGGLAAFIFPRISHTFAFFLAISCIAILELINYLAWSYSQVVLSFFFPVPTLATIFAVDLISIFLLDRRRKKREKNSDK